VRPQNFERACGQASHESPAHSQTTKAAHARPPPTAELAAQRRTAEYRSTSAAT